ncbi:MAG: CDP-glycerol glycerophosphotransferase family protein [Chloroflexota bacterium]
MIDQLIRRARDSRFHRQGPVRPSRRGSVQVGPGGLRIELSSAVVGDAGVEFGGRVSLFEPFPGPTPLPAAAMALRLGGRAFPVGQGTWVQGDGSRREFSFHVTIPLDQVPEGIWPITLRMPVLGREVTFDLWPSDGIMRAGRRRRAGDAWVQVRPGHGTMLILRAPAGGIGARVRWDARQLAADVAYSLRPRRPGSFLADMVRTYQVRHVWREWILRQLTWPLRLGGPIWLVGERTDTAQDNGRAFFRYLRTQHPRRRAYYVIRRDAPNREKVLPFGNVVWHGGLRHRLLALHADVLVGSHNLDRYLLPTEWGSRDHRLHLLWRIGSKRAYLKHGVLGVRTLAFELRKAGLDICVAVGPPEAEYIRSITGYTEQVRTTGLPRYDLLAPTPPKRVVVLMPTWRQYLVPPRREPGAPDSFTGSHYEAFFRELLTAPRLHAALERHDYTLEFYPHYNIDRFYRGMEPPHPRIRLSSFKQREVKDALIDCGLFITDWSSVVFDAAYLGRAVIHAPFDEAEYLWGHYGQGWMTFDTLGFGPVARDVDQLLGHIERYLATGCEREPLYTERAATVFSHRDQACCQRVDEAILAL